MAVCLMHPDAPRYGGGAGPCSECARAYARARYHAQTLEQRAEHNRRRREEYAKPDRTAANVAARARGAALKREAVDAYGGRCGCCGEAELAFLTIDHENDDGAAFRRSRGRNARGTSGNSATGQAMYAWLKREGWPSGHRVACWNCNSGRHVNGGVCPHEVGVELS